MKKRIKFWGILLSAVLLSVLVSCATQQSSGQEHIGTAGNNASELTEKETAENVSSAEKSKPHITNRDDLEKRYASPSDLQVEQNTQTNKEKTEISYPLHFPMPYYHTFYRNVTGYTADKFLFDAAVNYSYGAYRLDDSKDLLLISLRVLDEWSAGDGGTYYLCDMSEYFYQNYRKQLLAGDEYVPSFTANAYRKLIRFKIAEHDHSLYFGTSVDNMQGYQLQEILTNADYGDDGEHIKILCDGRPIQEQLLACYNGELSRDEIPYLRDILPEEYANDKWGILLKYLQVYFPGILTGSESEDKGEEEPSSWKWRYDVEGYTEQGEPYYIQIPELTADVPAFEEINREINQRVAVGLSDELENGDCYISITSQVSERDGVLSLMILREEYPIYGTDPVRWAVTVDLEKGRKLSLEEVLERAGKDSAAVLEKARQAVAGEGLSLIGMDQFYCAEDGAIQIIMQVEECPQGADPWLHYWIYDVAGETLLRGGI